MKSEKIWRFLLACVCVVGFIGLGCEDRPDTENVDDYFDGKEITVDVVTPTNPAELLLIPAGGSTVVAVGKAISFELVGSVGTVTWSLSNDTGVIITASESGATYQRTSGLPIDNIITAKDSLGREAYNVIKQE